ncbi:Sensor histidine kinase YehU [Kordia antarctica]|uniref:Sensor histidine kinase YehU n=1 Tax=Kordia antarctica TaxID=1218801 RepID=A0A7L4ZFX4_9FLAO|nr:histidine kinase [Kordia antarctica]QHI34854.1 Sensor histidine kinase YehU [Kordia antarctica]
MNRRIFGVKIFEIVALISTYIVLSIGYHVTLWFNRTSDYRLYSDLLNIESWFNNEGLQYVIMFVATSVVWIVIFKIFRHWKLWQRLLLHFLGLPFFIFCSWKVFYLICESIGYWHMNGPGQVWDIYIPTLIYLIQFSLIHAYEYYIINQRKIQNEVELTNAALKSELSAIKAQLNPHFLYNVFNTINASVPKEMEETREMIAELSDLFRYQLKASREDFVTLEEELDFVKKYLKLEQRRFEDRLKINIDVSDDLLTRKIPPMILQPLVENSVKHGISPLVEGGIIDIIIKEKEDTLIFEINDTGVGIANKEHIFELGVGLGNTQKRLQKMYNSTLTFSDNVPTGLKVYFEL